MEGGLAKASPYTRVSGLPAVADGPFAASFFVSLDSLPSTLDLLYVHQDLCNNPRHRTGLRSRATPGSA
jgi:hypothetical protein